MKALSLAIIIAFCTVAIFVVVPFLHWMFAGWKRQRVMTKRGRLAAIHAMDADRNGVQRALDDLERRTRNKDKRARRRRARGW